MKTFSHIQKQKVFMTSIPALKEMLEGEPGKTRNENLDQQKHEEH